MGICPTFSQALNCTLLKESLQNFFEIEDTVQNYCVEDFGFNPSFAVHVGHFVEWVRGTRLQWVGQAKAPEAGAKVALL